MKIIALVLVLALSCCATQPEVARPTSKPVPVGTVAVATLVPGLPQLLTGQPLKALTLAAIILPAMAGMESSTNESGDALPGKAAVAYLSYAAFAGAVGYSFYDGYTRSVILNRQWAGMFPIAIGMTDSQLVKAKGRPTSINRTIMATTVHEQWVYSRSNSYDAEYYYFENGILTAIQN